MPALLAAVLEADATAALDELRAQARQAAEGAGAANSEAPNLVPEPPAGAGTPDEHAACGP